MGKQYHASAVFFVSLSLLAIVSTVSAQSNLVVVRAADDSLWKATCDGDTCGAFSNFPGMFRQQPSVTWDEKLKEWVVIGVASDNSIWKCTFDKSGNFNDDWESVPGATPSPTALAGGNLLEYGSALKVRQGGLIALGSSATIVIPHFIPFTIQFGSEWPHLGGIAYVTGMENDHHVAITFTKYDGSSPGGSIAYGGAECNEELTTTLMTVGMETYTCTLRCPGEESGDHNLVIQASNGLGCVYRVIY